ncbi:putative uncharacterized protein [Waddlia chondrophila 2032/99]|uniref:Uncharacterized protein n=2 Tax=Waddlia chondrophila TaxID=71667 RepID=D6YU67_WADCW|nr:hypothetical protein [Waddlia chondrophila]ADI37678.1 conserved hypothetical protein [Waddlia chondrophila WSU 86-1044]CCB90526.1 putative uncharacterized protein [Waddlia chondrophila 2032/99]
MREQKHRFIFEAGHWIGEGTVGFSASPEQVLFSTSWTIDPIEKEEIRCQQRVQMEGAEEDVCNKIHIYGVTQNAFSISLENEILGQVIGAGIIDEHTIAWEFRGDIGFQGYEIYEKKRDGSEYRFHAEYSSPDQFRTIIDGIITKS